MAKLLPVKAAFGSSTTSLLIARHRSVVDLQDHQQLLHLRAPVGSLDQPQKVAYMCLEPALFKIAGIQYWL